MRYPIIDFNAGEIKRRHIFDARHIDPMMIGIGSALMKVYIRIPNRKMHRLACIEAIFGKLILPLTAL